MDENLRILEEAISDVGYWSWWDEKYPDVIQIEFGGTLLWNDPKSEGEPPSGQIALRFINPKSVSFIKTNDNSDTPQDWYDLLRNDQIEPFSIDYENFGINNKTITDRVIEKSKSIVTVYGFSPNDEKFLGVQYSIAFIANGVGLIIGAEDMKIVNQKGYVLLEDIEEKSKKWWQYWKEYWNVKGTGKELPKDYACEITIPLAPEK